MSGQYLTQWGDLKGLQMNHKGLCSCSVSKDVLCKIPWLCVVTLAVSVLVAEAGGEGGIFD